MPRKKSRQAHWQRKPNSVNWRGQRPKFNPLPVPITAYARIEHTIEFWRSVRKAGTMIVDESSRQVEPPALVPLFNKCPPRLAATIIREEKEYFQTEAGIRERVETRLRGLLRGESEE
jgi:hypothetical protein